MSRIPEPSGGTSALGDLVANLQEDQRQRWQRGEGVPVEAYLERYPELRADSIAIVSLIYQELRLREQRGERPTTEEFLRRFPAHTPDIERQFRIHHGPSAETVAARSGEILTPLQIGKYRIVEPLGRGGQGEVYRAVHPALGRDVVLKWAVAGLPEESQRLLLDEGRVLARLDEPGVVRVFDVDIHEGRPFLVFEHVVGRSLADVLRSGRPSPRRAAALAADLAAILERVHRKGVLHRDLKPANVLIDDTGRPRLLDFGLASLRHRWDAINPPGPEAVGTLPYMPPEQANGEAERVGVRSDVFGLGAVLYELLTGSPPHPGTTREELWRQARAGTVTPPRQIDARIPPVLERVCLKALAPDPGDRFASAGEFGAALRGWRRRPALLAAAVGAAVVLGVVLAAFWPRPGAPTSRERAEEALTGELSVLVWSPDGLTKQGLPVEKEGSGALPVLNGEKLQLVARLSRPAHVYLLWLDSEGKTSPLFPWNESRILVKKLVPPPDPGPRGEVRSPSGERQGWKMEGKSGLETILLLVRRERLPAAVKLDEVIGELPPVPLRNRQELAVRGFDPGPARDGHTVALHRGPAEEVEEIDAPLLQLLDRLRHHFELIRAVRFAHLGEGPDRLTQGERP